jgi:hypothetical protein
MSDPRLSEQSWDFSFFSLSHLFEIPSPAGMSLVSLESPDGENVIFFSSSRHREMNMTTVLPCIGMFQIFFYDMCSNIRYFS